MSASSPGAGPVSASALFTVGAALGACTTAGAALLLYTGQGFLGTAGFLIAVSLGALAAGLWVGAPEPWRTGRSRGRWMWTVIAFGVAAGFAAVLDARPALRGASLGGALAVLLILAEPAYASGSLLAMLARRRGRAAGAAVPALLGAAVGVLLATTTLIPSLDPPGLFLGAAVMLAVVGRLETARRAPPEGGSDMTGRVVIVTGVGDEGQLGFAIAERFRAAGARVVITSVSNGAESLAPRLGTADEVAALGADLTTEEGAAAVAGLARERFGRVDALVNAAGGLGLVATIADSDPTAWDREIERNAGTAFRMSRAALPLLRASHGSIINFASPAGERAVARLGAYSAAKASVIALTRALALEERATGVRVNAIAPGIIDTRSNRRDEPDRTRWVTREQIAAVVLFLASSESSGVSGQTIHVPGDTLA